MAAVLVLGAADVNNRFPTAADMAHMLRQALAQPDLPAAEAAVR